MAGEAPMQDEWGGVWPERLTSKTAPLDSKYFAASSVEVMRRAVSFSSFFAFTSAPCKTRHRIISIEPMPAAMSNGGMVGLRSPAQEFTSTIRLERIQRSAFVAEERIAAYI